VPEQVIPLVETVTDDWLTKGMRKLVERAVAEATARGTATVEAEHVLLALATDKTVGPRLERVGLDYAAMDAALRAERVRSLAVAGIEPVDPTILQASPRALRPRFGASIAVARSRAERSLPRKLGVLVGILRAEHGTVPRALALAGVDRGALIEQLVMTSASTK
jgi:ATP-dependent Clp protease ATP-binding subunit ClpA